MGVDVRKLDRLIAAYVMQGRDHHKARKGR